MRCPRHRTVSETHFATKRDGGRDNGSFRHALVRGSVRQKTGRLSEVVSLCLLAAGDGFVDRDLWNVSVARSLRFNAGKLNHLGPFIVISCDLLAKFVRCADQNFPSNVRIAFANLSRLQEQICFPGQSSNDSRRRSLWGYETRK